MACCPHRPIGKDDRVCDTPVIVSVVPSSLAPAELRTKSEGTGPVGVAWPIVFMERDIRLRRVLRDKRQQAPSKDRRQSKQDMRNFS